jgi:hypothetical protein
MRTGKKFWGWRKRKEWSFIIVKMKRKNLKMKFMRWNLRRIYQIPPSTAICFSVSESFTTFHPNFCLIHRNVFVSFSLKPHRDYHNIKKITFFLLSSDFERKWEINLETICTHVHVRSFIDELHFTVQYTRQINTLTAQHRSFNGNPNRWSTRLAWETDKREVLWLSHARARIFHEYFNSQTNK